MVSIESKSDNDSGHQRRREAMGRRLLPVVAEMLEHETFTQMSVERLVAEAGISRSSFYVYFEDKGDLLGALTEDVILELFGAAQAWWSLAPSATREELRSTFQQIFDAYYPHRRILASIVEFSANDAGVALQFETMMGQAVDAVVSHILSGQDVGRVRADIRPQRTAKWLTWMLERGLQMTDWRSEADTAEDLDAVTDIVWHALYID